MSQLIMRHMYDSTQSVYAGQTNTCQIHLLMSTTHSTANCGFFPSIPPTMESIIQILPVPPLLKPS